jgi:uncharacterized protein (DUF736 family)
MAIIGTLERDGEGFSGHLATLMLNVEVRFAKADRNGTDKAPDFKIFAKSGFELGAGWLKRAADTGRAYISCLLDSPELPAPILASLIPTDNENRFLLVWSRLTT